MTINSLFIGSLLVIGIVIAAIVYLRRKGRSLRRSILTWIIAMVLSFVGISVLAYVLFLMFFELTF